MQSIRILEMPTCKMVSSGSGMFGENFVWPYVFEDGMAVVLVEAKVVGTRQSLIDRIPAGSYTVT